MIGKRIECGLVDGGGGRLWGCECLNDGMLVAKTLLDDTTASQVDFLVVPCLRFVV